MTVHDLMEQLKRFSPGTEVYVEMPPAEETEHVPVNRVLGETWYRTDGDPRDPVFRDIATIFTRRPTDAKP